MSQLLRTGYLGLLLFLLSMLLDASDHLIAGAAAAPPVFSFNFSAAPYPSTYSQDLVFQDDAVEPQKAGAPVELTCTWNDQVCRRGGRMSYAHPVQLYQLAANGRISKVASFSTSFTFAIRPIDRNGTCRGDGMAFFLASFPSKVPYRSAGGNLGLIADNKAPKDLAPDDRYTQYSTKRIRNVFDKGTGGARRFEYRDLAAATDHFSEDRKLGQGAFGAVYSGYLKLLDHQVAVKKIVRESSEGHKDFFAEVRTISEAKHKNLVKFFGWCSRGHSWNILRFMCSCFWSKKNSELFLVYELMTNGNLNDYLYKSQSSEVLSWQTRYKIAKDIGSGLLYLHHECDPHILHRDIKPGNVLLDENFNAKLADFGLSRMANQDNATLLTTAIGSEGYLDPQCLKHGKVPFKRSSDVYSFGIALLEIACARRHREQIWDLYRSGGNIVEAADTRLTMGGGLDMREIERVIVLGLWSSALQTQHRPSMRQAMDVLERDGPLPDLNSLIVVNTTLASTTEEDASSAPAGNRYDCDEAPLLIAG
uniref:Protein kinase domain-containing protein n=1 Tax=Oryza glumipatula TaxID=40148 RepID=A0A0D9ZGQ2_9ORYZ